MATQQSSWPSDINLNIPAQGPAGKDGKTPVRGVDYWTSADQEAVEQWAEGSTGMNKILVSLIDVVQKMAGSNQHLSNDQANQLLANAVVAFFKQQRLNVNDSSTIDNVTETGLYNMVGNSQTTSASMHLPIKQVNAWSILIVIKGEFYCMQMLFDIQHSTDDHVAPLGIYFRGKNWVDNTSWTAWNQLSNEIVES